MLANTIPYKNMGGSTMERKVSTAYLKIGMYVSKLDRPWRETSFLMQGFFIMYEDEILSLAEQCDYIYIDTSQGLEADTYLDDESEVPTIQRLETNKSLEDFLETGKKKVNYQDAHSTVQELPVAKAAFEAATEIVGNIMNEDVRKDKLDFKAVKGAVEPIIDSMIRNSDAFVWMIKMQQHDLYTYDHSVQNSALGIAFGRHMGLNKIGLQTLAMGLLLMDVGKAKLPKDLLSKKTALTAPELEEMKRHVGYSVDILKKTSGISDGVINIALTHHERYDGSGYPNGLVGVQTPIYGRIAAIIDCYDAMTTETPYRKAVSEHAALQNIYNLRDQYFQQELVEQFLQCMGVYPTGSLVELSTGEVGVILSQNVEQRLKPRIMMLLDEEKNQYDERRVIDLAEQGEDSSGMPLHISKGLDQGEYGVDTRKMNL
jgi:HD-GYP domain-containing protein (c-di-GMP phosphodiesterase class II)